jgi:hypothetical protein
MEAGGISLAKDTGHFAEAFFDRPNGHLKCSPTAIQ